MNVFFLITVFLIFFNYQKKKKKNQNQNQNTSLDNWGLTEYQINNNWKLEDWNDKTESLRTEMKKTES